jgi:fermentation-respiration switch protein FrsA (DUF1100 family)
LSPSPGFDADQRAALERDGQVPLPSEYGEPLVITRHLIAEGRAHLVLRAPLALPCPVRFLQGTADADVAVSVALRLLEHAQGPDMRLTLVDGADHRFSSPDCLGLIRAWGLSAPLGPAGQFPPRIFPARRNGGPARPDSLGVRPDLVLSGPRGEGAWR